MAADVMRRKGSK